MRLAFVIQRYGLEIGGGAEELCRQVVERLAAEHQIEVLTTCAQDYNTWTNAYPAGEDRVNGVLVHRFPVIQPREATFGERSARLFHRPHTLQDELDWLTAQGPLAPDLLRYVATHRFDYDAFAFSTYVYPPAAMGTRLVADRALLMPNAHDEPPIYLDMYKGLFHAPRAIAYNTAEEKELLEDLFGIGYIPSEVIGIGIDTPAAVNPEAFRHKFNLTTPYLLYVGRVSPSKHCDLLIDDFIRYKTQHPDQLSLVFIGREEIEMPERDDIISLGFLSEEDKYNAMAGATLLMLPSKYESLSIVTLESFALGTPVLCEGSGQVMRGHCLRSNAGLFYANFSEFEASLSLLLGNLTLRHKMGQNGRQYIQQHYTWSQVIEKYNRLFTYIKDHPWF